MDERTASMTGMEWLEADGLGGFASGTASGIRTRRYHGLLTAATPRGRMVLVNGLETWVETPSGRRALTSHLYVPGVIHPDGSGRIESFTHEPWPRWTWRLDDGTRIEQQVMVPAGSPAVAVSWRLLDGAGPARLRARLLLSGRDYHATHHENGAFRFEPRQEAGGPSWSVYDGVPQIRALSNGRYEHDPVWYRGFLYEAERERGLDHTEDLASPGAFVFDLARGEAALILHAADEDAVAAGAGGDAAARLAALRGVEMDRRAAFATPLHRAADSYLIRSRGRRTIIAGYPWFTDWGRDTFIALRGICLATGRLDDAREILLSWAPAVDRGMLPNLFPDGGAAPEYNSVDSSLWYVVAAGEYLDLMQSAGRSLPASDRDALDGAIEAILDGTTRGTRYGIHADDDGLLASGAPGVQLTWMDARIGDRVVTPRRGKPVEVQALWLNALQVGARRDRRWREALARGTSSFASRFWNERDGCLFDVVDVEGQAGTADPSFRPNQIFAVGGLPVALLDGARAASVVRSVEQKLLTPPGLRSLAPGEPGYAPRYEGGPRERDAVYHQGTVWPWLMGPFVEAWVRVRRGTRGARQEARRRFLAPLLEEMNRAGLGHLPEIADAEPPHRPRGCPFQAWSVAEALRLELSVLADRPAAAGTRRAGRGALRAPGGPSDRATTRTVHQRY